MMVGAGTSGQHAQRRAACGHRRDIRPRRLAHSPAIARTRRATRRSRLQSRAAASRPALAPRAISEKARPARRAPASRAVMHVAPLRAASRRNIAHTSQRRQAPCQRRCLSLLLAARPATRPASRFVTTPPRRDVTPSHGDVRRGSRLRVELCGQVGA